MVGNNDIATVFDPFGTAGGADDMLNVPGDFDIAPAFGDGFSPEATGANYLVEILPTLFQGALPPGGPSGQR